MTIAKFIQGCKNFEDFVAQSKKLPNKGNWKKNRLGKDTAFEFLTKLILEKHPLFKKLNIKNVWHESEIPSRDKKKISYPKNIGDEGIDFLVKTKLGKYHAIQSKFRGNPKETLAIGKKSDLGTTFNLVNGICKNIENIYVFATINSPPKKYKLIPKNCIFILNSFFKDFNNNISKWNSLKSNFKKIDFKDELKNPELFQEEAIKDLKKYFKIKKRGCLFLPCGTGKTLISYWFAKEMNYKKILILVPNLTLVSQILNNWVNQDYANNITKNKWLVVCSDKDVRLNEDPMVVNTKDLPFETTTDEKLIKNFLKDNKNHYSFIISTYNSSHKICSISKKINYNFDLCIFDEAHKTVGTKDKLFSKALHDKNLKVNNRLFMTATKRIVHGHKNIIDMSNKEIYGEIAHELSFKNAIENNNPRLCNYRFRALGVSKDEILQLWKLNPKVRSKTLDSTTMKYLSGLILLFKIWKKYNLKKGITFHNTIGGSENFKSMAEQYQPYLNKMNDVEFFNISSKKSQSGDKQSIIEDFSKDKKSIITNARCLVEGVDVPAVDLVLFSDKNRSRVDIVQAIGRCLRKSGTKKFGYVIVPFIFDKKLKPENLLKSEYKDVIKTIRILSLYDKTFAEDIKLASKNNNYFKGKVEIDIPEYDKIVDIDKIRKAIKIENFKSIGPLNWLPFDKAKEYIQSKNIQTSAEYFQKHKDGKLDADLPFDPKIVYGDEGFTSWGDFLGTGRIANQNMEFVSLEDLKEKVQDLKIKSQSEYWKAFKEGKLLGCPQSPDKTYAKDGWLKKGGWGYLCGHGKTAYYLMKRPKFKTLKKIVQKLKLKSANEYFQIQVKSLSKKGLLPVNSPRKPDVAYPKDWKGWPDFLGKINKSGSKIVYIDFEKLKLLLKHNKINSEPEYEEFYSKERNKITLPRHPSRCKQYSKFWKDWDDFLDRK